MDIKATTKPLAIIGSPVSKSLSPFIYNESFKKTKKDLVYLAFECKENETQDMANALKKIGILGGNVTYPLKKVFYKICDEVSEHAKIMGAVNCFKMIDGKIIGYNTDGLGLIDYFEQLNIDYKNENIMLLGAGGAGSSIGMSLAIKGAKNIIIKGGKDREKAKNLAEKIKENFSKTNVDFIYSDIELQREIEKTDILINASPIGMGDNKLPIPEDINVNKNMIVMDIIYNPRKTPLMKMADKMEIKAYNGLGMLLGQARLCYEIWFDEKLDMEISELEDIIEKD